MNRGSGNVNVIPAGVRGQVDFQLVCNCVHTVDPLGSPLGRTPFRHAGHSACQCHHPAIDHYTNVRRVNEGLEFQLFHNAMLNFQVCTHLPLLS
jgi:hypothetical protein